MNRRRFVGGMLASGVALAAGGRQVGGSVREGQKPLRLCLVSGSVEYKSDESLAAWQPLLERDGQIVCSRAFRRADDDLPGLEALESADVMLLFTRRLTIDGDQLARVKAYCDAGRPIVGVRTASHAFQNWLALDREVLGGNYKGHYPDGPETETSITEEGRNHPVMRGVEPIRSVGSLYRNQGLAEDCTVLMTGTIPEHTEPITWHRTHRGGRVFYTSLGHPEDFKSELFLRMLTQAVWWAAGQAG